MLLTLDQHIYGKTKDKDFSTLAISREISKENLKILEKYSIYKLPNSLLYDAKAIKPKKYVYYKLNDESMVLGSGVDVGKDEFGRVGNFLFHNLIFKIKELEKLRLTPISLIRYFEENSIFQREPFHEGQIPSIDLEIAATHQKEVPTPNMLENETGLLPLLLYACFYHTDITAPIYITGDEDRIFDFLDKLFSILPKRLWPNLSVNTFWYEDYTLPGLSFYCNSIKSDEIRPPNYSLKIDFEAGTYESKIDIQDRMKYEYAKLAAKKALNDKQGLSDLYLLQELAETPNWNGFIEHYGGAPQNIRNVIYGNNRENISTEISQGNIGLFNVLKRDISMEDLNRVFKSKKMIDRLLENRDEIIARDFVEWFYDMPITEDKRNIYPVFLSNVWLFDLLLNKIRQEKSKNIEVVQNLLHGIYMQYAEQKRYNQVMEEKVLEICCELLENNPDIDTAGMLKVVKKLPPSNDPEVLLLRALIRYRLEDSSELVSLIKEKGYQPLLCELINKGMKTIDWERHKKAFRQNEPKPSILKLWR
jgi:predicted house-cleaning noncanonical NTP pyrophosphatase (MazG superfamily)